MNIPRRCLETALFVCLLFVATPASAEPVAPDPRTLNTLDSAGRKAARAQLVGRIEKAIDDAGFEHARVGIHVISLEDGTELFAHDADTLLNPASNMKIITSSAALELLGPEFYYETELYADALPDANGVIDGNVYLKGKGDPTLVSERMWRIVNTLWHKGVRRINGDIVIDESYFDDQREGPGWEQENSDRAYIAPTGAMSMNFNAVAIHVRAGDAPGKPAIVSVDPESDYFMIENRVKTGTSRSRRRDIPSSSPHGTRQKILVRGRHPINRDPAVYYRRIDNPPYYVGETFKAFMKRRGVRFRRGRVRLKSVPASAVPLHVSYSRPMAGVVRTMNKVSQNHIAEMLVKTMGAEVMGAPGSWAKGVAAVERYLEKEVGIPRGTYVMKNGSGLNDTNRFSARQLTKVLVHGWNHFQIHPEFVASLAVAGKDGTTRWRLDETLADGLVRAKTGTLENVSALSGYATTAAGEYVAFSIIVNDHPARISTVVQGIDAVAEAIASYGLGDGDTLASTVTAADGQPIARSEASDRVLSYLALRKAADPRNIPFLRSALRHETEPLVRAVIAEAIYLSDREVGARMLIDNYTPDASLVGRLRTLSHDSGAGQTPVITSIVDLAAEGRPRALQAMLVTTALAEDDGLRDELAADYLEVGRTAPTELMTALLDAEEGNRDAALTELARGLRDEKSPAHHPFMSALVDARREAAKGTEDKATEIDEATRKKRERLEQLSQRLDALMKAPPRLLTTPPDGAGPVAPPSAEAGSPTSPAKGGGG